MVITRGLRARSEGIGARPVNVWGSPCLASHFCRPHPRSHSHARSRPHTPTKQSRKGHRHRKPHRRHARRDRLGTAVSVVTREQIDQRQTRIVSDVLRDVPGVAVSRSGGAGTSTQMRMRGGEANHTLVLFDGADISDPFQGEFDFAGLLADRHRSHRNSARQPKRLVRLGRRRRRDQPPAPPRQRRPRRRSASPKPAPSKPGKRPPTSATATTASTCS